MRALPETTKILATGRSKGSAPSQIAFAHFKTAGSINPCVLQFLPFGGSFSKHKVEIHNLLNPRTWLPMFTLSFHWQMFHWFPLHSWVFSAEREDIVVHSHMHLAITDECFTHSLPSCIYIQSITRIWATKLLKTIGVPWISTTLVFNPPSISKGPPRTSFGGKCLQIRPMLEWDMVWMTGRLSNLGATLGRPLGHS